MIPADLVFAWAFGVIFGAAVGHYLGRYSRIKIYELLLSHVDYERTDYRRKAELCYQMHGAGAGGPGPVQYADAPDHWLRESAPALPDDDPRPVIWADDPAAPGLVSLTPSADIPSGD